MAVVIETTLGDITIDLYLRQRPVTCLNFLKLCKMKYYNFNLFHTIRSGFIAQTGDPTGEGSGGESIFGLLEGPEKRFFSGEKMPKIRHTDTGLLSMVCTGDMMVGSQFFFTLGSDLDSLDGIHCVIGEVTEGHEVLRKLNDVICDESHRPYQDVRITHTVILEDPFNDPPGFHAPSRSPSPSAERLKGGRIAPDEEIDETLGKSAAEIQEMIEEKEAKARATILEIVGDIPDADIAPPENVLFVCKLNPVTTDEDLEIIFSRFGKIVSCEVIRDKKTGDSLQYAFIEFADKKSCEDAYFKMDNVLIDDRRIHVDFSQSVSKIKWLGKGRGVKHINDENGPKESHSNSFKRPRSRDREYTDNSDHKEKEKYSERKSHKDRNNDKSRTHDERHKEEEREKKHERHHRQDNKEISRDRRHKRDDNEKSHERKHREGEKEKPRDRRHKEKDHEKTHRHHRDKKELTHGKQNKEDNKERFRDKRHKDDKEERTYERRHKNENGSKNPKKHRERSKSRSKLESSSSKSSKKEEKYNNENAKLNISSNSKNYEENFNLHKLSSNASPTKNDVLESSKSRKYKDKTDINAKKYYPENQDRSDRNEEFNLQRDNKINNQEKSESHTLKRKSIEEGSQSSKEDSKKSKLNLEHEESTTPPVGGKKEKSAKKNSEKEKRANKRRQNIKRKRKPSTSSSDSDSSDSSSSSTDSSSSSSQDHKKRKSRKKNRKPSSSSSSSSTSSNTSSSSSDSSSDSSSSSSDSEPKKKRKHNVKSKAVKKPKKKL